MAKIDLAKLKAVAEKAEPGPWDRMGWHVYAGTRFTSSHEPVANVEADSEVTAAHIANCDPQTILALIEVVEAAREVESDRTLWERGFGPRLMRLNKALAPFTEDNE